MIKKKIVFFLDYGNINRTAIEKGYQLNYADVLKYISKDRELLEARCYVPINPHDEHQSDTEIENLRDTGYFVASKLGAISGKTYTYNFDDEIVADMINVASQVKPDVVILATGNTGLVVVTQELQKSGIHVEIAAFRKSTDYDIQPKYSNFLDLDAYYSHYFSTQKSKKSGEQIDKNKVYIQNTFLMGPYDQD